MPKELERHRVSLLRPCLYLVDLLSGVYQLKFGSEVRDVAAQTISYTCCLDCQLIGL